MAGKDYYPVIWLLKTTFFLGTEATGQLSRLVSFPFGRESRPILHERRVSLLALAHYNYGIISWGYRKQNSPVSPWGDPVRLPMGLCTGNLLPWQHPAAPLHDCLFEFLSSSRIFDSRLINHPSVNPWLWLFTHPWNQGQSDLSYLCLFVSLFIRASQVALSVKNRPANAGNIRDTGVIPGSERSRRRAWQPRPVFENPMDRGVWQFTVQGVEKNQTWLKQLSTHTHTHTRSLYLKECLIPSLFLSFSPFLLFPMVNLWCERHPKLRCYTHIVHLRYFSYFLCCDSHDSWGEGGGGRMQRWEKAEE